ncbi:MAG: hypothetical protein Q8J60_03770, partial [Thiobacillus sp.]|nr:hypothetical protein [Thiobacillus sp.]
SHCTKKTVLRTSINEAIVAARLHIVSAMGPFSGTGGNADHRVEALNLIGERPWRSWLLAETGNLPYLYFDP